MQRSGAFVKRTIFETRGLEGRRTDLPVASASSTSAHVLGSNAPITTAVFAS